jgi:mannosyl-oligosaccharide alpha-1,3-glucosidase
MGLYLTTITRWQVLALVLLSLVSPIILTAHAAKHGDFKTCAQSSFCRRLRSLSSRAEEKGFHSPYDLVHAKHDPADLAGPATWTFPLKTELYPEISFELQVDVLAAGDGIARLRVDEVGSNTRWKRYNETAKWALLEAEPTLAEKSSVKFASGASSSTISYGDNHSLRLVIEHSPFKITHQRDGKPVLVINERGLFHMEHFRTKEEPERVKVEGEQEQVHMHAGEDKTWFEGTPDHELFEENWGKWRDSKPKGESY